ncbi:MAG TPA: metallophosphoesterase [Anaerovoracaceae bacterium]|nr:metallophosphoesterase [Anaerovoracaceae bacterium]
MVKPLKNPKKSNPNKLIKNTVRIIFLILIAFLAVIGYARYIEPFTLEVNDVTVESPLIAGDAENLKIAVFGDTHFGDYYSTDDFDKVIAAIGKAEPDIVVFIGDLIDHYNDYYEPDSDISGKLSEIEAPLGKFAVFGNHDYGGGAEYKYQAIMEAGGFKVLKNEYFGMNEFGIGVIGIDDVIIGYGDPAIASWGRPDYFNIVIAHEPDLADEVLDYNVDLMISGHTHGRQVNLNFFDDYVLPPYGRNYISGLYEFENERATRLYVNSGIGMTKLPFRFLSPPELTCITLAGQPD